MDANRDPSIEQQFLNALYGHCCDEDGSIIVVAGKKQLLGGYAVSQMNDIGFGGLDHYFKVNLFDAEAMRQRSPYAIGSKSELKTVVALHLDVDAGKSKYASQEEVRKQITQLDPPPSAVVLSDGQDGGFHLYWFLDRPYRVNGDADAYSARIKGLRQQLPEPDGAEAADSAPAVTGLLRLPGSFRKSGNKVAVEELHADRRYPIDAFLPVEKPQVTTTESVLPGINYPATRNENSIVGQYLDETGESLATVLQQHGWQRSECGEWTHPESASGARSAIEYFHEGRPGITVYSSSLSPQFEQYRWYSREACFVQLNFHANWNAAAAEAHRYLETAQIPVEPHVAPPCIAATVEEVRGTLKDLVLGHQNEAGTLSLVRAPTGLGKSHATRLRMERESSSRLITNVHSNCNEEESQMPRAVAYPSVDLCEHEQREKVLGAGLTLGTVLCPDCPMAKGCIYRLKSAEAANSPVQICTHHRANVSEKARGLYQSNPIADFVAIHEECLPQQLVFTRDDLVVLLDRLSQGAKQLDASPKRNALRSLAERCRAMLELDESTNETTTHAAPAHRRVTDWFWEPLVWDHVKHSVVSGAAVRSILDIHLGKAKQWSIVIQRGRTGESYKEFVVDWQPDLSPNTVFFDATGDAGILSLAWGVPVRDITPTAALHYQQFVRQISGDVKRSTSRRTSAGYVRALLTRYPEIQHLGLITQANILDELELEPQLSQRITRQSYFGNGSERASNAWMDECDAILILGTWRPPQDVVRRMLVRLGKMDAARCSPDWVERAWEASNGDVVHTKKYDDAEWHQVHKYLVQSEMMQCIGRARPFIDEGIPCFVVSNEPLGLPYDSELKPIMFSDKEQDFNAKLPEFRDEFVSTRALLDLMADVPRRTAGRYIEESPYLRPARQGVYSVSLYSSKHS